MESPGGDQGPPGPQEPAGDVLFVPDERVSTEEWARRRHLESRCRDVEFIECVVSDDADLSQESKENREGDPAASTVPPLMGKTFTAVSFRGNCLRLSQGPEDMVGRFSSMTDRVTGRQLLNLTTGDHTSLGDLRDLVSFEGCEELLRGADVASVLRRRGSVWRSSQGSADMFAMSAQVDADRGIDVFLSHNWCISRVYKFVALALYFNTGAALALFLAAMALLAALGALGLLPVVQGGDGALHGYVARAVGPGVFLWALFFCHDIPCFASRKQKVFLDKLCISQTDPRMQAKAIKKLGAFLCHSHRLLILYTDEYLQKLWTVYEVAAYLALKSTSNLKIIPVELPLLVIWIVASLWVASIAAILCEAFLKLQIWPVLVALSALPFTWAVRRWELSKAQIGSRLARFTVRDCKCAVEEDRPLVYRNIATLVRHMHPSMLRADEDTLLAAFDEVVRSELPEAVLKIAGRPALGWRKVVLGVSTARLAYAVDFVAGLPQGVPVMAFAATAIWEVVFCAGVMPVQVFAMQALTSRCLHLRGVVESAFVLLVWVVFVISGMVPYIAMLMVAPTSDGESGGLLVFSLMGVAVLLVSAYVWRETAPQKPSVLEAGEHPDAPGIRSEIAKSMTVAGAAEAWRRTGYRRD